MLIQSTWDKKNIELMEKRELSSSQKGPFQNNVQTFSNVNKSSHSLLSKNNVSLNKAKDNESAIVIDNSTILSESQNDISLEKK